MHFSRRYDTDRPRDFRIGQLSVYTKTKFNLDEILTEIDGSYQENATSLTNKNERKKKKQDYPRTVP